MGWYFKTCNPCYLTLFIAHNYSAVCVFIIIIIIIIIIKQNEMALPPLADIFCFFPSYWNHGLMVICQIHPILENVVKKMHLQEYLCKCVSGFCCCCRHRRHCPPPSSSYPLLPPALPSSPFLLLHFYFSILLQFLLHPPPPHHYHHQV